MKVTLNNGTELTDVIKIDGRIMYFQGANRDSLTFHVPIEGHSFEELNDLFTPENTARIIVEYGHVEDENGNIIPQVKQHEDYSLRVSVARGMVEVDRELPTDPEVLEERYTVTMARKTYVEKQLEALEASTIAAMEGLTEVYEELITKGVI